MRAEVVLAAEEGHLQQEKGLKLRPNMATELASWCGPEGCVDVGAPVAVGGRRCGYGKNEKIIGKIRLVWLGGGHVGLFLSSF